jgi:glutaredoxin-like protein NrdH
MVNHIRKIRLFALSTCPACRKVKKFLADRNIRHEVIDVDTLDRQEQTLMLTELRKYNPQETFPTVIVEEIIVGHDEESLEEALDLG